jgi:hypothetical protein
MTDDELRAVLAGRLAEVRGRIAAAGRDPATVTVVAVTKTVSARVAGLLPGLGVPALGENRPQSLWAKAAAVVGASWHLIGHLQRNKLDRTLPLVGLVHSVDSERLLEAIDAFGRKAGTPVPVLLEVNASREGAKGGFAVEAVPAVADRVAGMAGVRCDGLMTMAAHAADPEACRPTFAELRELRDRLRTRTGLPLPHLSMGMSNDYPVAVQEGATLVRPGTALFAGLEAE